ncbi:phage portal protein [Microtetraspora niveoalba]|uniref:phage portal protein n=1 Tax=Microtetraspora niveoalba TaxID=46175 RepID=UPI00082C9376|nr:phage portal protein [Microtetraspora niveoalba]
MPLPSGGTWPPKNLRDIYDTYTVLNAWYRGDRDELATAYGDTTDNRPANRPTQYRGGLVGKMARWFWGAPTPAGEKRTKLHVPVASDIATMSADLLFSEPPSLLVQDPGTQARIEDLVENGLQATLLEGAEVGAALGGYYLRSVWDNEVSPRPWLSVVHADGAVPEWRWDKLHAVTFWRVIEQDDKGKCLYHLERHEPGWILNRLYRGAPGSLDQELPLTAHPETANLKPAIETKVKRCTAVYIANMRPNRDWRRNPVGANLGRSDFAGAVLGLMDSLDETWTSWMRDIRLAKARLVVPRGYLTDNGPGKGASFDLDRELYEEVSSLPGEGLDLSAHQFAIRVEEHKDTAAELLAAILRATGYSAQSFGLSNEVAVTATEIMARERRSLVTKGKKALYTRPDLADAIETHLELEAALFNSRIAPERPTIVFGDSIAADIQQLAQTAMLMRQAEAASDDTIVRLLHPDWDETEIQAEVARIVAGRPEPVADPFALRPPADDQDGEQQDGEPSPLD